MRFVLKVPAGGKFFIAVKSDSAFYGAMDRKWRRTTVVRKSDSTVVPIPDDWALVHESGAILARIYKDEDRSGWIGWCAKVLMAQNGELRDTIMAWFAEGKEAREYCDARTEGIEPSLPKEKRIKKKFMK